MRFVTRLYLALLGLILAYSPLAAADKASDTLPQVLRQMRNGNEYTVEFQIKSTGEKYAVPEPNALTEPWLIEGKFDETGKGAMMVTIVFPRTKKTHIFVSKGLTEDIFAVRKLGHTRFPTWYAKALKGISTSKDVQPLDLPTFTTKWEDVTDPPREISEAFGYAKAKYDEKRPELMKRFHNHSADTAANLYYADSERMKWKINRDGKKLYVYTGTMNRVGYFELVVEFDQTDDGQWRYVRLMAEEGFKGE